MRKKVRDKRVEGVFLFLVGSIYAALALALALAWLTLAVTVVSTQLAGTHGVRTWTFVF